jgi:hypothetical protein
MQEFEQFYSGLFSLKLPIFSFSAANRIPLNSAKRN